MLELCLLPGWESPRGAQGAPGGGERAGLRCGKGFQGLGSQRLSQLGRRGTPDLADVTPDVVVVILDVAVVIPDLEIVILDLEMVIPDLESGIPNLESVISDLEIVIPDLKSDLWSGRCNPRSEK